MEGGGAARGLPREWEEEGRGVPREWEVGGAQQGGDGQHQLHLDNGEEEVGHLVDIRIILLD